MLNGSSDKLWTAGNLRVKRGLLFRTKQLFSEEIICPVRNRYRTDTAIHR